MTLFPFTSNFPHTDIQWPSCRHAKLEVKFQKLVPLYTNWVKTKIKKSQNPWKGHTHYFTILGFGEEIFHTPGTQPTEYIEDTSQHSKLGMPQHVFQVIRDFMVLKIQQSWPSKSRIEELFEDSILLGPQTWKVCFKYSLCRKSSSLSWKSLWMLSTTEEKQFWVFPDTQMLICWRQTFLGDYWETKATCKLFTSC